MFLVLLLEEVDACCVLVPEWVSATFFFFFPGTDSFAGPHVVHMLASGHNTHK